MTTKDLTLLSETLAECMPEPYWHADALRHWKKTCIRISYALAVNNDNFDRHSFLNACGTSGSGT